MVIRVKGIEIDRDKRTISHNDQSKQFSREGKNDTFGRVCYFILGGGVSCEMAFFKFYGDDPDGGPLEGPKVFNILLNQWQERFLNTLGLEWRSHKIAGVSFYEIVPTHQLIDPRKFSFTRSTRQSGMPIYSTGKPNV